MLMFPICSGRSLDLVRGNDHVCRFLQGAQPSTRAESDALRNLYEDCSFLKTFWRGENNANFSGETPPLEIRRPWSRSADLANTRLYKLWPGMGAPACSAGPFRPSRDSTGPLWARSIIACNPDLYRFGPRRRHDQSSRSPRCRIGHRLRSITRRHGCIANGRRSAEPHLKHHSCQQPVMVYRARELGDGGCLARPAYAEGRSVEAPARHLADAGQRRIPRERSRPGIVRRLGAGFVDRSRLFTLSRR